MNKISNNFSPLERKKMDKINALLELRGKVSQQIVPILEETELSLEQKIDMYFSVIKFGKAPMEIFQQLASHINQIQDQQKKAQYLFKMIDEIDKEIAFNEAELKQG